MGLARQSRLTVLAGVQGIFCDPALRQLRCEHIFCRAKGPIHTSPWQRHGSGKGAEIEGCRPDTLMREVLGMYRAFSPFPTRATTQPMALPWADMWSGLQPSTPSVPRYVHTVANGRRARWDQLDTGPVWLKRPQRGPMPIGRRGPDAIALTGLYAAQIHRYGRGSASQASNRGSREG
jgi:hypothetical protein